MKLLEFFAYENDPFQNPRYDNEDDITVRSLDDTRKTKLTLKQINALRKSIESKAEEYDRDMERVNKMYAQPSEPAV
tara:strand:+ start:58 stop:288 length:231 start_codon:yes stop_codon:yes gene_type:complete